MKVDDDSLPKTGKSADWLAYADKREKEFRDHHKQRNILGQPVNGVPLEDDFSKRLSDTAVQARKMGMDLLRKEKAREDKERSESARAQKRQKPARQAKARR